MRRGFSRALPAFACIALTLALSACAAVAAPTPTPVATPMPSPAPTPTFSQAVPCAGQDPTLKILPSIVEVRGVTPQGQVQGSGFVVDPQRGYVMTATHVVANVLPGRLTVTFRDQRTYPARPVASTRASDMTLLQTERTDFPALSFAPGLSATVPNLARRGAVHQEMKELVAVGLVDSAYRTAIGRTLSAIVDNAGWVVLEADGPARPGMSGGPVVNRCGELVGVLSLGRSTGDRMVALWVDSEIVDAFVRIAAGQPTPTPRAGR
ncbi:MAG: serine protease [Dehalococcoidia bacterium]|nr:serine protease [Dehalococcoidia bacterium]